VRDIFLKSATRASEMWGGYTRSRHPVATSPPRRRRPATLEAHFNPPRTRAIIAAASAEAKQLKTPRRPIIK